MSKSRSGFGLVVILLAAVTAFPQSGEPTPTPLVDTDVVKISTNLIQLDVTVVDKKGKPITDIRPDEIEIYENGEKQKITALSFIAANSRRPVEERHADKAAVPAPTGQMRPEQVRRTIALVVDDLSLSFESAYYTRRALKKFVDEQMMAGDLVAIIRTGAGVGALQQFTADRRMLFAAIEKVRWNAYGTGGISTFAAIGGDAPLLPEETDEAEPGQVETLEEFRAAAFATGTLGALRYVVGGMSELPGRKSVILFSQGFRLYETRGGMQQTGSVLDFVRRLIDTANRASVVFYAVDPRGLAVTGLTAADNTSGMTPEQIGGIISGRNNELYQTQDGLRFLTAATGGFAVVNNNDLPAGVRKVLEDQSYYLVAYEPDSDTFDPVRRRFNKIEVKIRRPGAEARYRSGFFNVADRTQPRKAPTGAPINQLYTALMSPFAMNGINLRLNALFGSDAKGAPYVRSLLHVDVGDLKFIDEPSGQKKLIFDVLAASFGDNGQVVEQLGRSYTLTIHPNAFARIQKEGFVYHFVFPVKKPGPYQYRVALRDSGGRVGSASQFIEVPNVKKKRLIASSIVIENLTADEWRRSSDPNPPAPNSDPFADTALRKVKAGSIVRYGFEIYNAKLDPARQPRLTTRLRIFRDGRLVLNGTETPVVFARQDDVTHIKASGAIAFGSQMEPGEYVMQVVVTDALADKKRQLATQVVQFEVVP